MFLYKNVEGGRANVEPVMTASASEKFKGVFSQSLADSSLIHATSGAKSHVKWALRQVSGKDSPTLANSAFKAVVSKNLQTALLSCLPKLLRHQVFLPKEMSGLYSSVFDCQAWALRNTHTNISVDPFGISELRLLMGGEYCVMGVKIDEVDGDKLSTKMGYIASKDGMKVFVDKAKAVGKGFMFVHDEADSMIHIPPGYIVFSAGKQGENNASGIRWGFMHDETTQQENCRKLGDNEYMVLAHCHLQWRRSPAQPTPPGIEKSGNDFDDLYFLFLF